MPGGNRPDSPIGPAGDPPGQGTPLPEDPDLIRTVERHSPSPPSGDATILAPTTATTAPPSPSVPPADVSADPRPEPPVVNVVGERVALGPLRRDLLPTYRRWANDLAAADRFGVTPRPVPLEQTTAWYDGEVAATDRLAFTIYERATWRPIGTGDLNGVEHRHGTASLAIRIGEPEARGRGYGTEAVRLLLDVAFTALGLHSVMLTVAEYNLAGRRAYAKAGFRECGRRRESVVLAGRRWDELLMECLATEFESPVLRRAFAPDEPRP